MARWARFATFVAAASLGLAAVWGISGGALVYGRDSRTATQFLGQDIVTLLLGLPTLLWSLRAVANGSARGRVVWAGMLVYFIYSYYFALAGMPSGIVFPVHAIAVAASISALVLVLSARDLPVVEAAFATRVQARVIASFLLITALLFTTMWMADITRRSLTHVPLDSVSRAVYAIDLSVALPATGIAGVALWTRAPWGCLLAGMMLVKIDAVMLTLLVNTALAQAAGVAIDAGETMAYAATCAVATVCLARFMAALDTPLVARSLASG